jgi:hypothetical protein
MSDLQAVIKHQSAEKFLPLNLPQQKKSSHQHHHRKHLKTNFEVLQSQKTFSSKFTCHEANK